MVDVWVAVVSVQDWIQFEEIGDAEENAQSNYFENMMQLAQEQQGFGSLPGQTELISCPAALGNEKDDVSAMCSHEAKCWL